MSANNKLMVQKTDEWRQWRCTRGGASEIAALLGCSPWFPRTPFELWSLKTGRAEVYEHAAMRRGAELEDAARRHIEAKDGEVYEPQVMEDARNPRIIASLDGISFDGATLIEIKIPAAGRDSDLWRYVAEQGMPPEHYVVQCQQQLMCSGAQVCRFAVCEGDEIVESLGVDIEPDPEFHDRIRAAWAEFFPYLDSDTPPPMTDRDVIERADAQWGDAAAAYLAAKAALKVSEIAEKAARARLQQLAGEQSAKGYGVAATRYWRAGGTDWRKAAESAGVDGAGHEKMGAWQWRISG